MISRPLALLCILASCALADEAAPFSTRPPAHSPAENPHKPHLLWADQKRPYETNAWYANFGLGSGHELVNVYPYVLKAKDDEMKVMARQEIKTTTRKRYFQFSSDWAIGTLDTVSGKRLYTTDKLYVTVAYFTKNGRFDFHVVKGMGFVTAEYEGARPLLRAVNSKISYVYVDDSKTATPLGTTVDVNHKLHVKLGSEFWSIYFGTRTRVKVSSCKIVVDDEVYHGHVQLVHTSMSGTDEDEAYDRYAHQYVYRAYLHVDLNDKEGIYKFEYMTRGRGDRLLMFAQPHHEGILTKAIPAQGISNRTSLRGPLRGYEGKEWVIR